MYTTMLMLGCVKQADTTLQNPIAENQVEQSLDAYFSALAEKNLIQGSIIITQNGEPLFQKPMAFSMPKEHTKPTLKVRIRLVLLVKHTQQR